MENNHYSSHSLRDLSASLPNAHLPTSTISTTSSSSLHDPTDWNSVQVPFSSLSLGSTFVFDPEEAAKSSFIDGSEADSFAFGSPGIEIAFLYNGELND